MQFCATFTNSSKVSIAEKSINGSSRKKEWEKIYFALICILFMVFTIFKQIPKIDKNNWKKHNK